MTWTVFATPGGPAGWARWLERGTPIRHLATSHPVHPEHQDRAAEWFGFTSIQDWSRTQHALMLKQVASRSRPDASFRKPTKSMGTKTTIRDGRRRRQEIPPKTLRRTAWEIAMAGAYGTTGESARRGTASGRIPRGWMKWPRRRNYDHAGRVRPHGSISSPASNGGKPSPHDELVNTGAYCVAEPGKNLAAYLPNGRHGHAQD